MIDLRNYVLNYYFSVDNENDEISKLYSRPAFKYEMKASNSDLKHDTQALGQVAEKYASTPIVISYGKCRKVN